MKKPARGVSLASPDRDPQAFGALLEVRDVEGDELGRGRGEADQQQGETTSDPGIAMRLGKRKALKGARDQLRESTGGRRYG
jgi:hypothetical protein